MRKWKLSDWIFAAVTFSLVLVMTGILLHSQTPPPPPPQPVALTEAEKTKQDNIELRFELLQRDQQDFIASVVNAHHIDVSRYRYDMQSKTFYPLPVPPAAAPAPAKLAPPAKK